MQIKNFNQIDLTRVVKKVDLIIPAQTAKLGPPVGPVLGQVKIKVKDFCTMFNDGTLKFKIGLPLRVVVFVFKNESFNFLIRTPSTSFLLKNAIKLNKSEGLSLVDLYKIATIKKLDFPYLSLQSIFKSILVTARSSKFKIIIK